MATIRKRRDKVRGPGRRAASGRLERDAEPAWHDKMATYKRYAEAASAIDKVWRDQVVRPSKTKKRRSNGLPMLKCPTNHRSWTLGMHMQRFGSTLCESAAISRATSQRC